MRVKAAIFATVMLVTAACSAAAPAAQQSTEADITLSGPVSITLWHALSGAQQVALDAMVKKFNETNGKGITVTALNQGNYTQLYQKTLGAIQAGALPELAHAYESFVADYMKADVVVDLGPYKDRSGYSPKSFDYQGDLATGKLAFFFSSTSTVPFMRDLATATPFNWSIANLPQAATDPAKAKTVQFGANVAVFKTTPEKQLA